jgi:hypothetical protein
MNLVRSIQRQSCESRQLKSVHVGNGVVREFVRDIALGVWTNGRLLLDDRGREMACRCAGRCRRQTSFSRTRSPSLQYSGFTFAKGTECDPHTIETSIQC